MPKFLPVEISTSTMTTEEDTTISILSKYLHPPQYIQAKWSDHSRHGHSVENMTVVVRIQEKIMNKGSSPLLLPFIRPFQ
jgi:hypothetical protein